METVKFEALSIRDAIKKVREDLGKDAVIISTREVQKPLSKGAQLQKIVEVIASPAVSAKKNANEQQQGIYKPSFPVIRTKEKATVLGSSSRSTLPPLGRSIQANTTPSPESTHENEQQLLRAARSTPDILQSTASPATPNRQLQLPQTDPLSLQTSEIQSQLSYLRRELRSLPHVNVVDQVQEIKVLLHEIMRNQNTRDSGAVKIPEVENICIKLRSAGVVNSIIADIGAYLESTLPRATPPDGEASLTEPVLAQTIKYILKNLKVADSFKTDRSQSTHCLVGPTGAGKTTMIAKLAASLKLKQHQQVGLVSLDTQRISGSDQLRVYSKILDVPFYEARDQSDLCTFIEKSYHLDAIFLDTSGRSAVSRAQSEFLESIKELPIPVQFHLVLPAMMKQRDLEETVRAYETLGINSIIFTKLDESWSFGEIFNIAALFKIPMSYFGIGQSVPEDLEKATKERVIERLLRI